MQLPQSEIIEINHPSDVGGSRRASKVLAKIVGFDLASCEEIALVMTELATNLIKHAKGGTLTLTPLAHGERVGLEIQSLDDGPGIVDVEQALMDRFSTSGTRGTGLGAVNRLVDELEITSQRGQSTRVVCRKWVRHYAVSSHPCPLEVGVATRSRNGAEENGDTFVVKTWSESTLVGIIDGLGHGHFAHHAAQAARQYVESHYDQSLDQIFRGVGRACRATRGVVMALARFDWMLDRLVFASLGNIEVRVFPRSEPFHFTIRRGVIGLNAPAVVVTEHLWPIGDILVLHSDGLRSHWGWKDFPSMANQPATLLAQQFLKVLAKEDDDATVIVVRSVIS
jgi:anti-sigma regulatory factor (Ser/Thr protein kinase)